MYVVIMLIKVEVGNIHNETVMDKGWRQVPCGPC